MAGIEFLIGPATHRIRKGENVAVYLCKENSPMSHEHRRTKTQIYYYLAIILVLVTATWGTVRTSEYLDNLCRFELALDLHLRENEQGKYSSEIYCRLPEGSICVRLSIGRKIAEELVATAKYHIVITDLEEKQVVYDKKGVCSEICYMQNNYNFLVLENMEYKRPYKMMVIIDAPQIPQEDISLIKVKLFSYGDLYKQDAGLIIPFDN